MPRQWFIDPLTARRSLQIAKLTPIPRRGRRPQRQASAPLPDSQAFRMRGGAHPPLPPRRRQTRGPIPATPPRGVQSEQGAPLDALFWKVGWGACACALRALVRDSWRRVAAEQLEAVATVARS